MILCADGAWMLLMVVGGLVAVQAGWLANDDATPAVIGMAIACVGEPITSILLACAGRAPDRIAGSRPAAAGERGVRLAAPPRRRTMWGELPGGEADVECVL
jgi:hypothetical protein